MDETTKREVEKIIKQGWYSQSQTFGEGGWGGISQSSGV